MAADMEEITRHHALVAPNRSRPPRSGTTSSASIEGKDSTDQSSGEADEQKLRTICHVCDGLENLGYDKTEDSMKWGFNEATSKNVSPDIRTPDELVDGGAQTTGDRFQSHCESVPSQVEDKAQTSRSCSVNTYKGVTLALLSTLAMCLGSLSVSALSGEVSPSEVFFFQTVHIFLFSVSLGTFQKASFRMKRVAALWVLYRCVIISIGSMLAYYAYQVMPVGNAKAIVHTSPIFTGIFSRLLLNSPCNALDVILSLVTLGGVLLVIQPPFIFGTASSSFHVLGAIFSLLCAILQGTAYIVLRKLSFYRVHPQTLLFGCAVIGIPTSIVVTTSLHQSVVPKCWSARLYLIAIGVLTFVSHWLLTVAAKYERPTIISIIRTSDVMFAFILEYFFFGRIPNYITIIGAGLIVSCLVGISLHLWWSEEKRRKCPDDNQKNS